MRSPAKRRRAVPLTSAVLVAGVVAAGLAGCSGSSHASRRASVAPSFTMITASPGLMSPTAPSTAVAAMTGKGSPTAGPTSGSSAGATTETSAPIQPGPPTVTPTGSAAVPCPLPPSQELVQGESAKASGNGQITFTYLAAQRICGPGSKVTLVATTKATTSATVDPNATVFVLPPGGNGDLLQIPAAAFPDELKATSKPVYFAITSSAAGGPIEQIAQYAAPNS